MIRGISRDLRTRGRNRRNWFQARGSSPSRLVVGSRPSTGHPARKSTIVRVTTRTRDLAAADPIASLHLHCHVSVARAPPSGQPSKPPPAAPTNRLRRGGSNRSLVPCRCAGRPARHDAGSNRSLTSTWPPASSISSGSRRPRPSAPSLIGFGTPSTAPWPPWGRDP